MKNKILLFLLSLTLGGQLFAQNTYEQSSVESVASGFESVSEAKTYAEQIVKATGKKANFKIMEASIPNAAAVLRQGKRYILYNPNFIDKLTELTGTKWAAISVLAHEIGHHMGTHVSNGKTIPLSSELEADEFSGFVLRKMGATLEEAQAAMKVLATTKATPTHPGRADRLVSIARGWGEADGSVEDAIARVDLSDQQSVQVRAEYPIDTRFILANLKFKYDPSVNYHITTRLNVVKVKDNKLFLVGRLSRTNDDKYPFIISDAKNTKVYVNREGELVNEEGENVGSMMSKS